MDRKSFIAHLKDIIDWILIGLLVLGFLIMYGVARADNFNVYIFGIGLALTAVPALTLWLRYRRDFKGADSRSPQKMGRLKKSGERIEVDLHACEVLSTNWTSGGIRYNDQRIQMLNALGGDPELNVRPVNHNISRIIYKTKFNGINMEFINGPIAKDEHTLKMLLEHQGKTVIYVDRNEPNHYFFDLDFLED